MALRVISLALLAFLTLSKAFPFSDNVLDDDEESIDLSHLGPGLYGEPDSQSGANVAAYNPQETGSNPEELGNYLEGDMLMTKGLGRNGLTASSAKWPGGVVPYEIRGSFGESSYLNFKVVQNTMRCV